jgi:hypothetical protein
VDTEHRCHRPGGLSRAFDRRKSFRRESFAAIPKILCLFGALGLLALMPRVALAQPPVQSFAELQSILKPNDEVQITDSSGRTTRGRVVRVATGSLNLTVNGRQQELLEATIRDVKRRRPDVWWNGALIGAVAGTVAGAAVKRRNCGSTDCGEGGLVDPGFYVFGAAFGAGAGALIDSSVRRFDTLFARSSPSSVRMFSLTPFLSRGLKGFQLSVTF